MSNVYLWKLILLFEKRSRDLDYDNLLGLGDLNAELKYNRLNDFPNASNLKNLNQEPNCFKNPSNPSCIDLFLANRTRHFQNTSTVEAGISDFPKLVVTVLKMFFEKQKLKIIQYKNYKTFNEQLLGIELGKELAKIDLSNAELAEFYDENLSVLNKHAPVKYKYIRANYSSLCFVLNYAINFLRPKQKNYAAIYTASNL